jgi:hypothetical protein
MASRRKGCSALGCLVLILFAIACALSVVFRKPMPTSAPSDVGANSNIAYPVYKQPTPEKHSSHDYGTSDEPKVHVNGYTRKDGTHVRSYERRSPSK